MKLVADKTKSLLMMLKLDLSISKIYGVNRGCIFQSIASVSFVLRNCSIVYTKEYPLPEHGFQRDVQLKCTRYMNFRFE